ncbi:MAG: hypothetical protein HYY04_04025 [Chloroflexi bacterium]|nr:hypothetical protein [Chloroflexota bacterium]
MKTVDEIYISGMFTVARVGHEELELGPALERARLVLISREEWESLCTYLTADAKERRVSARSV